MEKYLVDVAVVIQAFIRPKMLEKQWSVIKKAKPSKLFIRSDGPRNNVPTDVELINESRKITEDIDWQCEVHRLYFEENLGLYGILDKTNPYIWEHVDSCIFLEDDQIPSISFFKFCAEMLERYKDDLRIDRITGVNLCGEWSRTNSDYFFANVPVSSGAALWKRSYEMRDTDLKYAKDSYVLDNLNKILPWYLKKQFRSYAETGTYAYHKPSGEFFTRELQFCQHQLVIVPKKNLITNIGVGEGSTHTASKLQTMPRALQRIYSMPVYELEFPLKHPEFVMPDYYFAKEREKQLGVASRLQALSRRIERYCRLLFFGEFHKINQGIARKVNNIIEK